MSPNPIFSKIRLDAQLVNHGKQSCYLVDLVAHVIQKLDKMNHKRIAVDPIWPIHIL